MQFNFYGQSDDVVLGNWLVPQHGDAPEAQRQHGQPVSTVSDSCFWLDLVNNVKVLCLQ